MILMLIFLFLSVILIIFTAIYLNKMKHTTNSKDNKTSLLKDNVNKRKTKKQLSNILQLKIKDNIIYLDNRFSCILKLGSIDYHMLSNKEQETIENILIETSLSIDYPIQFFSTTEFIDTSKVIEKIKKNEPKNWHIQEYQNNLINYLDNLMENRTISVIKNYAIISYYGNYNDAIYELNRKSLAFKSSILRANISCNLLNEDELYNLIYRELNKNSSPKINTLKEGGKHLYVGKKQKQKK